MNSIRMRFPGGKRKAFTMSYDDGVEQDVRLISVMRKKAVKGTFNLNSGLFAREGTVYPAGQAHRRMTLAACKKAYAGSDMEVAVHGFEHPFWNRIPDGYRIKDIIRDRETLETEFGCLVRGAAYPYGAYDESTINALDACGIVYCRTVASTHSFAMPDRWLKLDPTCHHNDPELFALADRFLADTSDRDPLLFYLWGHAYEFEINDNWQRIEDLIEKVGGQADIWYATNIEIYDYARAYERLLFSADGKRVYNPSVQEVWFWDGSVVRRLGGGESCCL